MGQSVQRAALVRELNDYQKWRDPKGWVSATSNLLLIFFVSWLALLAPVVILVPHLFEYIEPRYFVPAPVGLAVSLAAYMLTISYRAEASRQFDRLTRMVRRLSDQELNLVAESCDVHGRNVIKQCFLGKSHLRKYMHRYNLRPGQRRVLAAIRLCSNYPAGYIRAGEILPAILESESKYLPPDEREPQFKQMGFVVGPMFLSLFFIASFPIVTYLLFGAGMLACVVLGIWFEQSRDFSLPLPYDAETMADLAVLGKRYAVVSLHKRRKENELFKKYSKATSDHAVLKELRNRELLERFGLPVPPLTLEKIKNRLHNS